MDLDFRTLMSNCGSSRLIDLFKKSNLFKGNMNFISRKRRDEVWVLYSAIARDFTREISYNILI